MQGGMKACPRCGTVNDAGNETCETCDYNFKTGEGASSPPPIIAEGEVPRIEIDDSSIKGGTSAASGRRVIGFVVAAVALLIVGIAGYVVFAVSDSINEVTAPFEIELPNGGTIEIPTNFDSGITFTKATCTEELQDGLTLLLRRQAANKSLNEAFTDLTRLGVGSFEYRTLIELYSDFDTQVELSTGSPKKAVAMARRNAAAACSEHYAD